MSTARDTDSFMDVDMTGSPVLEQTGSLLQAAAPVAVMSTLVDDEARGSSCTEESADSIFKALPSNSNFALPSGIHSDMESSAIATSPLVEMKMELRFDEPRLASDVQLSQQMPSSLASPPESTDTYAGLSPRTSKVNAGMTPPATASSSRHSSHPVHQTQQYSPESGGTRRASTISIGEAVLHVGGSPSLSTSLARRGSNRGRGSTAEADEDSLRLIKELTAQEMGLRRRGRTSL